MNEALLRVGVLFGPEYVFDLYRPWESVPLSRCAFLIASFHLGQGSWRRSIGGDKFAARPDLCSNLLRHVVLLVVEQASAHAKSPSAYTPKLRHS